MFLAAGFIRRRSLYQGCKRLDNTANEPLHQAPLCFGSIDSDTLFQRIYKISLDILRARAAVHSHTVFNVVYQAVA